MTGWSLGGIGDEVCAGVGPKYCMPAIQKGGLPSFKLTVRLIPLLLQSRGGPFRKDQPLLFAPAQ